MSLLFVDAVSVVGEGRFFAISEYKEAYAYCMEFVRQGPKSVHKTRILLYSAGDNWGEGQVVYEKTEEEKDEEWLLEEDEEIAMHARLRQRKREMDEERIESIQKKLRPTIDKIVE